MRSVKVFLTGGTGYIGAHLVRALLGRGHRVTVLTRARPTMSASDVSFVPGDLREADSLSDAMAGHEALIHHALIWDEQPTELELKDPRATIGLVQAAWRAGIRRVIYTSSVAVHRPFRATMTEADHLAPADLYGMTKAMSELALATLAQSHELSAITIRPGPVVGAPAAPGTPHRTDRRFVEFIEKSRRGEPITVTRHDGRQFIAAADLARVYAAALESGGGRETFLAADRELITWEEIARETVRVVGSGEVIVTESTERPGRFDVGKLERAFGLAFSARDAVREHIAHLAARPG